MDWEDDALLLSIKKKSADQLVLNLLTASHGRCHGLFQLKPDEVITLLPGSELRVSHTGGGLNKMGSVTLKGVDKGIIAETKDDISLCVVDYVNTVLSQNFSQNQPLPLIFLETHALLSSFSAVDDRWPLHFACWEMAVLSELGLALGLKRCRSAYRHGETIYLSKRSGKAVTRTEAGAFLDRMMPVPNILMGARNCKMIEVRQALELTALLSERSAEFGLDKIELPPSRLRIADAINAHQSIPQVSAASANQKLSEDDRRKRLLSLRPLLIGGRDLND